MPYGHIFGKGSVFWSFLLFTGHLAEQRRLLGFRLAAGGFLQL
jgi:hypothetical protein